VSLPGLRRIGTALLVAIGIAGAAQVRADEPRLQVTVLGSTFEGGEATLEIEMRRSLADQLVTLTVTVDSEVVDRFEARGPLVRHHFAHPLLTAGEHEIVVRTGTETAETRIRVRSRRVLWWLGILLLLVLAGVAYGIRRRLRSPR